MVVPGTPNPKNPVRIGMLLPFQSTDDRVDRHQSAKLVRVGQINLGGPPVRN